MASVEMSTSDQLLAFLDSGLAVLRGQLKKTFLNGEKVFFRENGDCLNLSEINADRFNVAVCTWVCTYVCNVHLKNLKSFHRFHLHRYLLEKQ
jgi:hypothetical protein